MGRVAVLKIVGGDFDRGFQVLLQICQDGAGLPVTEIRGQLPPQTNLEGLYISWLAHFRDLNQLKYYRELRPHIDAWEVDTIVKTHSALSEEVEACREITENLEKEFHHWLQQSDNEGWLKIREKLIEELAKNPDSLRITIQAENRCLWKMPWHSWNLLSRYPEVGIGFSPPEFDPMPKSKRDGSRVRVLAVLGNSDNIDLSADRAALEALPDADVVVLQEPSAREIMQCLRDEQGWDIFCFAGHSESKSNTGRIYINQTESLTIQELKYSLREAISRGLKLAIFNSCDGLGLARELASLQLPVAIVMKEPVPDRVAQSFLRNFLKEYAGGKSLSASVRRARERLEEFKDLPGCTWLPIVCQNPAEVPPTWADLQGDKSSKPNQVKPARVAIKGKLSFCLSIIGAIIGSLTFALFPPAQQTNTLLLADPDLAQGNMGAWSGKNGTPAPDDPPKLLLKRGGSLLPLLQGGVGGGSSAITVDQTRNTALQWESDSKVVIAFSADEKYLATTSEDGTVRVWEIASGQQVIQTKHKNFVRAMTFSPDGKYLATTSREGRPRLWDIRSGEEVILTQD
ncbi:MAG: CHAT domain-containing protein [Oscillatoria sp. SIO1A7]|nr:CHAT domain-containing protein [Oscillatoria sp. SIO1A7]